MKLIKIVNPKTGQNLSPVKIWGVLNCTPDSFFDGGHDGPQKRIEKALAMVEEGARVIDVGGESTRPGAEAVSAQEETDRVLPVIEGLQGQGDFQISIDTSKAKVAELCLAAGADIVNDVTAGGDPEMAPLLGRTGKPIVLMHMQGTPRTMQTNPSYNDVVSDVISHLEERRKIFMEAGVQRGDIFFDPGIGFGKSLDHNLELMAKLGELQQLAPVLLGVSRKSFIFKIDDSAQSPDDRLPGSLAPIATALNFGVRDFRVHDVAATRQFIMVMQQLMERAP